jgi:DNA-binding response OmpR family regulator
MAHLYSPLLRLSSTSSLCIRLRCRVLLRSTFSQAVLSDALPLQKPLPRHFESRSYTRTSGQKAGEVENTVGILIIDDDAASQAALRQVLAAEGWFVEGADSTNRAFQELATGKWSLVLANVATTGLTSPLFTTLSELAQAPTDNGGKAQLRVLFLVPESAAGEAISLLDNSHLPYVPKPFNFHDLIERVSDLLLEAKAIATPIRQVREGFGSSGRKSRRGSRDQGPDAGRNTGMFARHEDYQWSDEELAEYERQEAEALRKKKKKPITLG